MLVGNTELLGVEAVNGHLNEHSLFSLFSKKEIKQYYDNNYATFNQKCKVISNAIFDGSMRMQSNLHICKDFFVQWLCLFVTFMVWFIDIYCAAVTCNHAAKNTIIPCLQANLRPVHIIGLCCKSINVEKYKFHRRKMQIQFYPGQLGRTMLHILKLGKERSWRKK